MKADAVVRGTCLGLFFAVSCASEVQPDSSASGQTNAALATGSEAAPNYFAGPADRSHSVVQRKPDVQISRAESSPPLLLARPTTEGREFDHAVMLNPNIRPPPANPPPDPVLQSDLPTLSMPAAILNFFGQGTTPLRAGPSYEPPDTNGAVGPSHFVQTVNAALSIWDKSGNVLVASKTVNSLFTGYVGTNAGNGCAANDEGDPVVVYDPLADRWFITQFSLPNPNGQPNFQCVAVSKTPDPTGAYWLYDFSYAALNDYGKFGIWPDAYYATYNQFVGGGFSGADLCAMDRASMLQGSPATQVCFQQSAAIFGVLPPSMDGKIPPPAGSPAPFAALGADDASLDLWQFHVDFATTSNSTLTGPTRLPVAAFSHPCAAFTRGRCVPEPTGELVEALGDRLMFRLAYRNFGTYESLVLNHAVVAGATSGIRWYEIRSPNSSPTVQQSGTYAPADSNWRWMASIAQDQAGELALGFSASASATQVPAIGWTGHLPSDGLGVMGQGETLIASGIAETPGSNGRWGDYSNMTVDPKDDCTFWYTQEYYNNTDEFHWDTRIATVKFPTCAVNDFSIAAAPALRTLTQGGQVTYTISTAVTAGAPETIAFAVQSLPPGVTGSFSPTSATTGTPSTLTLSATAGAPPANAATFTVIGKAPSAVHSTTAQVSIPGPPTVAITQPANGATVSGTVAVTATATPGAGTTLTSLSISVDGTVVQTGAASPQVYNWDTTTLANGSTHTLVASALDADGGAATKTITVTVKNNPKVVISAPTNGATVSGTTPVAVTAAAAVGTTLASVTLKIDGTIVQTGGSPLNYSWDTTAATQGAHSIQAIATDADGGAATSTISVTVKNNPTAAVTAPANGATVAGSVSVSATGAPALGTTLASLALSIDGTQVKTGATSPLSYTWDTTAIANGSHTLTATATDADGGTATASVTVTVKNLPAVAVTAPATGATVGGIVAVTATGAAPNGTTLASLAISIDGTQVATGATSPESYSWDTSALANGSTHTVSATATDADGGTMSASVTVTIKNNPVVAFTAPPDGGTVNGLVTVGATAAAPPGTTLATFALSIDGTQVQSGATSPLSYSWDTTAITNGSTHTLSVTATDADSTTASATIGVTVKAMPTVAVTTPDAGATLTGTAVITAVAAPSHGTTVSALAISVDGTQVQAGAASPQTFSWDTTTVANGAHALTAKATDADGASATSATVTVTVANTAPPVDAGTGGDGGVTQGSDGGTGSDGGVTPGTDGGTGGTGGGGCGCGSDGASGHSSLVLTALTGLALLGARRRRAQVASRHV